MKRKQTNYKKSMSSSSRKKYFLLNEYNTWSFAAQRYWS